MSEIPSKFYYIAGFMAVTQFGTFLTVLVLAFRAIWWAAKTDSAVADAKDTAVRAHKRIDFMGRDDGKQ